MSQDCNRFYDDSHKNGIESTIKQSMESIAKSKKSMVHNNCTIMDIAYWYNCESASPEFNICSSYFQTNIRVLNHDEN